MKVRELLERLSREDPELTVVLDTMDHEYMAVQGAGPCEAHAHGDELTFTQDGGPGCEEICGPLVPVFRISLGG